MTDVFVIQRNWQTLIKPKALAVEPGEDPQRGATVTAEPLERGFGLTLGNALRREMGEAEFVPPEGGYFMWVTLPHGTDVHALHKAAADRGVAFVKGTDFLLEGGENTLRLAFSGVTTEQIDDGVTRLAAAYRSL